MRRPAFQFYPADWRKDVELQSCSMAAQGLWINAMCLAHECEPYGHLTINGRGMTTAQLGRQVGLSAKEADALLIELFDAGVVRRTADRVYFSRRMVADEALRNARAAGGKAGAEHGIKGAEAGFKGGRPRKDKGGFEPPLSSFEKPPPSFSSSTSVYSEAIASGGEPPSARDLMFSNGVSLLMAAGVAEKNARAMLAGLAKVHGDAAVVKALNDCAVEKPIQPVSWLQASLRTTPISRSTTAANKHAGAAAAIFDGAEHV